MSSTFLSEFPGRWRRPASDYQKAIRSSLVVLDTNILLSLYRFTPEARNELLEVLAKIEDRLWVPHQVVSEYYKRRVGAVKEHLDLYEKVPNSLEELHSKAVAEIRAFANRCSLTDSEKKALLEPIDAAFSAALSGIEKHKEAFDLTLETVVDADPVLSALAKLFDGKTGKAFTAEEETHLLSEYEKRAAEKIPPGYRDAGKSENSHGDYFLWEQTIQEAASRQMSVLLVTNDAKEDWMHKEAGFTVGARPELVVEMRERANVDFLITQLGLFLKSAKQELGADVSPSTVAQAENFRSKWASANPYSPPNLKVSEQMLAELSNYLESRHAASQQGADRIIQTLEGGNHTKADRRDLSRLLEIETKNTTSWQKAHRAVRENIIGKADGYVLLGIPDEDTWSTVHRSMLKLIRSSSNTLTDSDGYPEIGQLSDESPIELRHRLVQVMRDRRAATTLEASAKRRLEKLREQMHNAPEPGLLKQIEAAERELASAITHSRMIDGNLHEVLSGFARRNGSL